MGSRWADPDDPMDGDLRRSAGGSGSAAGPGASAGPAPGGSASPTAYVARAGQETAAAPRTRAGPETRRPAAMCLGRGHRIVYANPAMVRAFGPNVVGLPAREGLVGLPPAAMSALDVVLEEGRARARWIQWRGEDWRLIVAPRLDPGTGETYGVSLHLRARSDVPIRGAP